MKQNTRLSWGERISYAVGDTAANLIYGSMTTFLLVYYTNVAHVDAAAATSIMAMSRIIGGVSDLVMGRLIDMTRSRWGKARPWLLWMCLPLAVCTVLMFSMPQGLTRSAQAVYIFITYNLTSTIFYTALNVPYSALSGLMTANSYERGLLGNFRMLFAFAGSILLNTALLKLCSAPRPTLPNMCSETWRSFL